MSPLLLPNALEDKLFTRLILCTQNHLYRPYALCFRERKLKETMEGIKTFAMSSVNVKSKKPFLSCDAGSIAVNLSNPNLHSNLDLLVSFQQYFFSSTNLWFFNVLRLQLRKLQSLPGVYVDLVHVLPHVFYPSIIWTESTNRVLRLKDPSTEVGSLLQGKDDAAAFLRRILFLLSCKGLSVTHFDYENVRYLQEPWKVQLLDLTALHRMSQVERRDVWYCMRLCRRGKGPWARFCRRVEYNKEFEIFFYDLHDACQAYASKSVLYLDTLRNKGVDENMHKNTPSHLLSALYCMLLALRFAGEVEANAAQPLLVPLSRTPQ